MLDHPIPIFLIQRGGGLSMTVMKGQREVEGRRIELKPSSFALGNPECLSFLYIQSFLPLDYFIPYYPTLVKTDATSVCTIDH